MQSVHQANFALATLSVDENVLCSRWLALCKYNYQFQHLWAAPSKDNEQFQDFLWGRLVRMQASSAVYHAMEVWSVLLANFALRILSFD